MSDTATAPEGLAAFKEQNRATWAAGDYPTIASQMLWDVGGEIVERAGPQPGERVLDIACGTGNATIRAALKGADVVGLDLTPELFDDARAGAAEAGVEVEWVEGDAEELPFGDASFDVVLSVFGCMFAPRHERAAAEIARVLRPDGRFVVCAWAPEGNLGQFFRTIAGHMPQPPDFAQPPPLWGSAEHVRGLFEGRGVELAFEPAETEFRFDDLDAAVEFQTSRFGPLVKAREMLEPEGRWQELVDDLRALYERQNEATDGSVLIPGQYLVTKGRKPA